LASNLSTKVGPLGSHEGVDLADYAWFWPGTVFTIGLAFAMSIRLAQAVRIPRVVAFGLILSLGLIASATLTPSSDALRYSVIGSGTCDLTQTVRPSLRELLSFDETSLNVLLFVPLGITVGLAASPRQMLALLLGSIALPFAIEAVQLVAIPLDRACQSVDVVDNLSGLLVGFVPTLVGSLAMRVLRILASIGRRELRERLP
jgi:hypothetical protein